MSPRSATRAVGRAVLFALSASLASMGAVGEVEGAEADLAPAVTLGGDFRLRLEQDWDSRRSDGSERADRGRIRARARFGLGWKITDRLSFAGRLRSGSDASHQSPHVTLLDFDGGDTGGADFNLDRWALVARGDRLWGWAGRDRFPFWQQNEFLWDDDVTLAGLAAGWRRAGGDGLSATVAYLSPPVGMRAFTGALAGGQLVYGRERSDRRLTLAAGLYVLTAESDDPDAARLRNGNGERDYSIVELSAQLRRPVAGRPLTLGLDYIANDESYGPGDPYAFANRDETEGYVGSVSWGSTAGGGDWLFGYWYADVGALAVNGSYAQDDWVRWGSAVETEGSDQRGHELRVARGLGPSGTLVARLFLVESRAGVQDGKRLRIDYNLGF